MSITLTESAVQEVKKIIKEQELNDNAIYLRVGVKGGGCSGFSYILDLSEVKKDNDEIFEINGIRVIVDPKSLLYLSGTKVDFKSDIMGRGFTFSNPNATSTCGCNSSFSA